MREYNRKGFGDGICELFGCSKKPENRNGKFSEDRYAKGDRCTEAERARMPDDEAASDFA